ncbi:hypothetical protein PENTCL1PPCAC_30618, partial [Pristionchus entomophagus]
CLSGQDTLTNRLVEDAIDDVIAQLAPFAEDIEQPAPGPGVCYENRTVSYNTTETVIKIETKNSSHFCFDFSAGFKCTKEERREVPTQIPTVKERDEEIAVCCEKYKLMDGHCVEITTPAPSTPAPTFAPRPVYTGTGPTPVETTEKPNGAALAAPAAVAALIPLLAAYLI